MPETKGQNFQDVQESALNVTGLSSRSTNETILSAFDQDKNQPLRLSESTTPDSLLNIKASKFQMYNGVEKNISPINNVIPNFVETTINFQTQAVTGGTVNITWPSSTVGQYRLFVLTLLSNGQVEGEFSDEETTIGALPDPGSLFIGGGLPIGWVVLECTNTTGYFKTAGSSTNIIENKVGSDSRIFLVDRGDSEYSSKYLNYATTAAYEAVWGTGVSGSVFFNTTTNLINYHNGTSWQALETVNPMTTDGDIITRDSGVPVRLGIGSTNEILTVIGGLPSWKSRVEMSAQSDNGQVLSSSYNAFEDIVFEDVLKDTDSGYNSSTGVYTFKKAGTYLCIAQIEIDADDATYGINADTGRYFSAFRLSGATYLNKGSQTFQNLSGSSEQKLHIAIVEAAINDTIKFSHWQSNNTNGHKLSSTTGNTTMYIGELR